MHKLAMITVAAFVLTAPAKADGLFMGTNWANGSMSQGMSRPASRDPEVRAEDNDGIRAWKLNQFSVQVPFTGQPYQGRQTPDGICDAYTTPQAWMNDGQDAYIKNNPTQHLYTSGRGSCQNVYYPGFTFFWGQPNMGLAPHDPDPRHGISPLSVPDNRWGG